MRLERDGSGYMSCLLLTSFGRLAALSCGRLPAVAKAAGCEGSRNPFFHKASCPVRVQDIQRKVVLFIPFHRQEISLSRFLDRLKETFSPLR